MFEVFLRRLMVSAPDRVPDPGARLALAALMVRVARTDGRYSSDERRQIDALLGATYGLSPADAAGLRDAAEALEAEASDTVRFTRALKEAVPHDDRQALVEGLWRVALADGRRDDDEEQMLRLVASLLGITDVDSALARQRAERT